MRTAMTCLLLLFVAACGDDTAGPVDAAAGAVDAAAGTVDAATAASDGDVTAPDASVGPDAQPNLTLSFFVTSTGSGANGGNLGGLAGADAKCQALGTAGGAGMRTWRAYLSTGNNGPGPIVSARDRIGTGPWFNQKGAMVAANFTDLHNNGMHADLIFTEQGAVVPSTEHDILTGSATDGTISQDTETCDNWTNGTVDSQRQVGHADTVDGDGESWNSQHSGSCDEAAIIGNAGSGRVYCFAAD